MEHLPCPHLLEGLTPVTSGLEAESVGLTVFLAFGFTSRQQNLDGWHQSESTAGRVFALYVVNLDSIPGIL